ncbi:PDR/VanB family oxidoreductase [Comamonas sp. JC664]|uniref:PDR/VanB family oxidoreductase n=1 Tax=Comamonas sp. JC664 TaxID=2801917 RepID=UPI001748B4DC|nr:PDR/VanB family oxidoreductase [Comamonas sp. JC664]MBL0698643.1 oxidoreductase [Comamonas sp. JC664]GHG78309.1 vanillate O-demethylase reductase subunit [Comamonas sp. KCTC 72670]
MGNDSLRVRVTRITREAEDILSYELAAAEGGALPAFEAGAHLEVRVPGPGDFLRAYSLCNDPEETHRYVITVSRDAQGRGGSSAMHERVREGDVLEVRAPRNNFPLLFARSYVLVAGGIGITPLLSMARVLERTGANYTLHYCAREPGRTAYRELLSQAPFKERVRFSFDGGDPAKGLDVKQLLATRLPGARLYCCGPAGLMNAVRDAATLHRWPREKVHFESFTAEGTSAATGREEQGFEVTIRSTGQVLQVPAGQTVLNVLRRNGVRIPSDCEAGTCGTCVTRVCDGQVDHRDSFFGTEPAGDQRMLVCVSRARSKKLVLDI